jgi:transcription-repair coupling factor (superfamily II helicase)
VAALRPGPPLSIGLTLTSLDPVSLRPTLELAYEDRDYAEVRSAIRSDEPVAHASASVQPFLIAALAEDAEALGDRPLVVVAPDDIAARDLSRELGAYLAPRRVRHYPSRGTGYASHVAPPPHLVGLRIAALDALTADAGNDPPVVVASAIALAEAVPEASLRPEGFTLKAGEEIDLDFCSELLAEAGYERVDQVEARGQFALRGGILDVFGATEERAARIELFGDEIESIRWFSTFTQRSLGDTQELELSPAAELATEHRMLAEAALEENEAEEGGGPLDFLPVDSFGAPLDLIGADAAIVIAAAEEIEPTLRAHWEDVTAAMHSDDAHRLYVDVAEPLGDRAALRIRTTAPAGDIPAVRAQPPASAARSIAEAEPQLEREVRSGYRVVVAFEHRGEAERARYNLQRVEAPFLGSALPSDPGVHFTEAQIAEGFISPALKLAVIPWRKLVHRRSAAAPSVRGTLASMADLAVGDHVVHQDHGIARFAGFETKTVGGVTRDYLELEYRGEDRVFAPTEQLAKITRYVGVGGESPQLSALGSKRWDSIKARARRAARALAGDLLNLYAERAARKGHAFGPDSEWSLQLEQSFPYRETADQLEAIEATRADMESERPMDRLICGDVGYGKTEVALRAAAKAASDGKQVMVLVPTTVLAQQHLGTFRERFAELPFEVDAVSRLRKPAEVRATLKAFAEGGVDILIGTHRLLSRDVRAKDLGLLVVDEEQRFGVKQKELLRQLKLRVDVLSMSATPIPRTLQMSLAGLRDISVIETPPEGRRPIRTYVGPYDEELVANAIKREVDRGGQCFFLHNRVETLHETAERLRAVCPGVRFAEAHGQMDMGELEATMLSFLRGDADCLVATTIIESGLDIPQANTLIVERADMLGLAQAYQIRGRVGRSKERAFAYMLHPTQEALSPEASARLATLSDHTELGSGFAIAMRDLELRGAGDLLGDEQSGHVAAIGFELYLSMLEEATEALRAGEDDTEAPDAQVRLDVDVSAYVPNEYIPFEAAKIELHRRVAGAREVGELRALRDELRDRFGPVPEPVEALLELQRARIEFGKAGARVAEVRGGRLSVSPLELDARRVGAIRDAIPEAMYETSRQTLSLRVPAEPAARLDSVLALAGALTAPEPALAESR